MQFLMHTLFFEQINVDWVTEWVLKFWHAKMEDLPFWTLIFSKRLIFSCFFNLTVSQAYFEVRKRILPFTNGSELWKLVASTYFILQVIANILTWSHLEPRYILLQTSFCVGNGTPKCLLDTPLLSETCQSRKLWNSNHITRHHLNVITSVLGRLPKLVSAANIQNVYVIWAWKRSRGRSRVVFDIRGQSSQYVICLRLVTNNIFR